MLRLNIISETKWCY